MKDDIEEVDLMSGTTFLQEGFAPNQKVLATLLLAIARHLARIAFPQETIAQKELDHALQLAFEGDFKKISTIAPDTLIKNAGLNSPFGDAQLFLQKATSRVAQPISRESLLEIFNTISEGFALLYTFDGSREWERIVSKDFILTP